jgi:uncharacterized membrane protein YphA (DoxX/SURF4 family)
MQDECGNVKLLQIFCVICLASLGLAISTMSSIQNLDLAVVAVVIALLGPGAFSIDARLFGRREILIPRQGPQRQ